jgi:hypothetical protein
MLAKFTAFFATPIMSTAAGVALGLGIFKIGEATVVYVNHKFAKPVVPQAAQIAAPVTPTVIAPVIAPVAPVVAPVVA